MADRAVLYRDSVYGKKFPASIPWAGPDGRLYGQWFIGNDYRNKSTLYGAYPARMLERLMVMYPDAERILHLFSGSLPKGNYIRFDLHPDRDADVYGDAQELSRHFGPNSFDLVIADPPYSVQDAEKYKTPMPNRAKVTSEVFKVLAPSGQLIWLDQVFPMHRKAELQVCGMIGITRSTNHRYRNLVFFRKAPAD